MRFGRFLTSACERKRTGRLGYLIYRTEEGEDYAVWPLQLVAPPSREEGFSGNSSYSSVMGARAEERTWPLILQKESFVHNSRLLPLAEVLRQTNSG